MEKNAYGFWGNMNYHFRNMLRWYPGLFVAGALAVVPEVAAPLAGAVMARVFTAGLEQGWTLPSYLGSMAAVIAVLVLCAVAQAGLSGYRAREKTLYINQYEFLVAQKKMRADYELLESERFQKLAQRVRGELWYGGGFLEKMEEIDKFFYNLAGSVAAGSILAAQNPWILLLLLLSAAVNYGLYRLCRRAELRYKDEKTAAWREMGYLTAKSGDISAGKDIRLYRMADWLLALYENAFDCHKKADREIWNRYFGANAANVLLVFLRDLLVYGWLIAQICGKKLSAADFVYFTGLVAAASEWMGRMVYSMYELGGASFCITCIREFLDQPDRAEHGQEGLADDAAGRPAAVEFRHVCYRYPGAKQDTIRDLCLTIRAGEKLAMVGLNGAGKTTFVKLLCRLYHPTRGEILINGIPAEHFTREEYFSLLSVLFQDSAFLPVSVEENIASAESDKPDRRRLEWACRASGTKERLEKLPLQGKTHMIREVWDDATDFSGGERQKLLLARAIYKRSSLLILDEPTAALDPIAEHEMYVRYGALSEGRTCIFISHRLASTRFCDRIVLLEGGRIAEEGTHEELLKRGGIYSRLFEVQSKYYSAEKEGQGA